MRKVEIIDVGSGDVMATLTNVAGRVSIQSSYPDFAAGLKTIRSVDALSRVTPNDGDAFLDAVLARYSGTYCQAVER